jgi:hypothetical protein
MQEVKYSLCFSFMQIFENEWVELNTEFMALENVEVSILKMEVDHHINLHYRVNLKSVRYEFGFIW